MPLAARITLFTGLCGLCLCIFNAYSTDQISPSLLRAEVIAGLTSVTLMFIGTLWNQAIPRSPTKVELEGDQGFEMDLELSESLRNELAWGSHLFLTATPAATILVYWNKKVILRRGIIGADTFTPGPICERAAIQKRLISLVKTALFPGSSEFDSVLFGLPSVMIYPICSQGWVILGGWSERCFTRSDEKWLEGWSERLGTLLEN